MKTISSYHTSFTYLGINSEKDKHLIISSFDPDSGESNSFLSSESVYTDSYNGSRRITYGSKYDSVATIKITLIKEDGSNFSIDENRDILRWLSGVQSDSPLDLYVEDKLQYTFICKPINIQQYKMDARVIGLIVTFESVSPWAYSPIITRTELVVDSTEITLNSDSDDLYSIVYMKTIYENTQGNSLIIENTTLGEKTEVTNLSINEIVTIDSNMMITSDHPAKSFGNSFNFVFPRLAAGENKFIVTGGGIIKFEYRVPLKVGDCSIDIETFGGNGPCCIGGSGSGSGSGGGTIIVEELSWENITNKPDLYTQQEIDEKIRALTTMIGNMQVDIDKTELNNMLAEVLI